MVERLIERVEGEATLLLQKDAAGVVTDAKILFPHFRGMEKILERKEALDALALTPRVCGICGHAHLVATARALEACYQAAGYEVALSEKARALRELTLSLEMVQNHIKWFALTLLPAVPGYPCQRDAAILAAHRMASLCARAIALMAGQWPHTSYVLPGGVMCDPTHLELLQATAFVEEAMGVFAETLTGLGAEGLAGTESPADLFEGEGMLPEFLRHMEARGWLELGRSHDRFLVLADNPLGPSGKALRTRLASVTLEHVAEEEPSAPKGYDNYAKPVRYRDHFYETGPLARAMVRKDALVRRMHRRHKDAAVTRVVARVREAAALLLRCRELLQSVDPGEPSYLEPPVPMARLGNVQGRAAVEAARGSLMHGVRLHRGRILRYCITTPTQWNLAGGTAEEAGVAQKALIGLPDEALAEMVFKSFDVCAVCTTQ
ncbi:nickel-dependent hydrogenase large subunit [Hydrogenimonas sp.]